MILIHTALLCEAQSFIEYYKLKKTNSSPKIYANDFIIICIGGIGEENTLISLNYIFKNYTIRTAFNIGIAGCNDTDIKIGTLFCSNHKLDTIPNISLITSDIIVTNSFEKEPTLYDMEAKYFMQTSVKYLNKKDIYIFKIVSDHLDKTILPKDDIKRLITKQNVLHTFINLD